MGRHCTATHFRPIGSILRRLMLELPGGAQEKLRPEFITQMSGTPNQYTWVVYMSSCADFEFRGSAGTASAS